jgi:hypothetical protein
MRLKTQKERIRYTRQPRQLLYLTFGVFVDASSELHPVPDAGGDGEFGKQFEYKCTPAPRCKFLRSERQRDRAFSDVMIASREGIQVDA